MNQDHRLTRREFSKIAGTFGLVSTLLGLDSIISPHREATAEEVAERASAVSRQRSSHKPRFLMRFGAAHFTQEGLLILPNGSLPFIRDLEERTDGEIRIEYFGGNSMCRELECAKMCINNDIDFFSASTQNASAAAPYLNVLDFPYLFPSRAAQYHFFYHPKSELLFREPLRKYHNLQFLFTHCELRSIMMGLKHKNKPKIMSVDQLKGKKLRVTGSQLGRLALKLLGTKPVPVAWSDSFDALKIGVIDGAETWSSAVPYGNWGPVITMDIHCRLFSGNGMTSMNLNSFDKIGEALQTAVMESAYLTQIDIQKTSEAKLVSVTGITDPPLAGSYYEKHNITNCIWPDKELAKAEQMVSPEFNPSPWETWRERLNRMAGGKDIYEEIHSIAREIPKDSIALDIEPRRWWKHSG